MIEWIVENMFYKQFINPGDLCFDIGANVGEKTILFLGLGARVVAVEPQPQCVAKLKAMQGHHPHLIIVNQAVGAAPGTAIMYVNDRYDKLSTLSGQWIKKMQESKRYCHYSSWNKQIQVTLTTLDQLIAEYGTPKFCKIDVEGYEYQVLQGLSTPIPALSFEFTRENIADTLRCIQHLQQLGRYSFNFCTGLLKKLTLPYFVDGETICQYLQQGLQIRNYWGDVYAILKD